MCRPKAWWTLVPALVVVLFCGCVNPRRDLTEVSTGLQQRTGHSLTHTKPGEFSLPPTVSLADGVSEDEAVALALWNNAAFLETLADLGLSRADLVQAGMLPNPSLSMLLPAGPKQLELTAKLPLEFLWLRPKRVAAAELDHERTAQRLVQSGLDLIRDVRLAFTELWLAHQRLQFSETALKLGEGIAELGQARLKAGDTSELEATSARVDVLQAREQAARLRQDVRLARERLRSLAGMSQQEWPDKLEEPRRLPSVEGEVAQWVTNSLAARPDLRAAEIGLEAAGKHVGLAKAEVFTFAAGLNAKDVDKVFRVGPSLDFAVPILNQNQGGIAQARARFEKAARQYVTVRDRIVLEVREAHVRLAQAQESRDNWQQHIVPPLEESVRQSEKAYAAGNVSYLFVLETSRKLFDARVKEAAAAADQRRAVAELERSVGCRLSATGDNADANGKPNE